MTIDPILQDIGRLAQQWCQGAQTAFQGFRSSIAETVPRIPQAFERGQLAFKNTKLVHPRKLSEVAETGITDVARELESWRKNSNWVDEKPVMEVSVPNGTLCQLNSTFKVGLPPLALFDILIDPENKRVFKDIQEVRHRKVLHDCGHRQIVEIEQAAIWRFLWLSGILTVFLRVDQDRKALSLSYQLCKKGFMKRFEGSWHIEPLYIDAVEGTNGGRVASVVRLQQLVEPALMPPPPLSWYVRGITSRTTEKLLEDLQAEGKRLREGGRESQSAAKQVQDPDGGSGKQKSPVLHRYWSLSSSQRNLRRKRRRVAA